MDHKYRSEVPGLPTKHIISPMRKVKVCALIDEESHNQIEDKVMQEFLPHEAQIILGISLSYHRTNDALIQAGTNQEITQQRVPIKCYQITLTQPYLVYVTPQPKATAREEFGLLA